MAEVWRGDKDTDKPDTVVSLHLAESDSNDDSDDNEGSVEYFEYDDSNNVRTSSDDESIAG